MTLYQNELRTAAQSFCTRLEKENYRGRIPDDSYRDYSVKVNIESPDGNSAKVTIYHKPSKGTFSLNTGTVKNADFSTEIHRIWEGVKKSSGIEIFIDGSFINGRIGWGMVVLDSGKVIDEKNGEVLNRELLSMRQVSGELHAAMEAVQWALKHEVSELTLCFDYIGIMHWVKGSWKCKNSFTCAYRDYMRKFENIIITWRKIDAHTGNRWNERADRLAKDAVIKK